MPLRKSGTGFAALCALAVMVASGAMRIAAADAGGTRQEISVDAATMDRYVGKYRVGSSSILAITRDGSQLSAQITGQPKLPIYAETPTRFFWRAVDARVTFAVGDTSSATSATIHQFGRDITASRLDESSAQALEQQLAGRMSRQLPQPGSEAALRKTITAIQNGAPNYGDMAQPLQDATRRQLPALEGALKERGPIQTVAFKGVADTGADKYIVTYQDGKQSQCVIALGTDGKIVDCCCRLDSSGL